MNFGIMQGRLVLPEDNRLQCFPSKRWQLEFDIAKQAKIDCIEWIYDTYKTDQNPIATKVGIEKLKRLSSQSGVKIYSICADYFMDHLLSNEDEYTRGKNVKNLSGLIERVAKTNINRIVIPFVDSSSLKTNHQKKQARKSIREVLKLCEKVQIELHLETDFNPEDFKDFLESINSKMVRINYDSGNSANLGYHPDDEFSVYGKYIGSVHIKDRKFRGSSVPLGYGNVDFVSLFQNLKKQKYKGDFILQVARGQNGEELEWCLNNIKYISKKLKLYYGSEFK